MWQTRAKDSAWLEKTATEQIVATAHAVNREDRKNTQQLSALETETMTLQLNQLCQQRYPEMTTHGTLWQTKRKRDIDNGKNSK